MGMLLSVHVSYTVAHKKCVFPDVSLCVHVGAYLLYVFACLQTRVWVSQYVIQCMQIYSFGYPPSCLCSTYVS